MGLCHPVDPPAYTYVNRFPSACNACGNIFIYVNVCLYTHICMYTCAVCCSRASQHVAVWFGVLRCVAVCCSVLQCVAVCCSVSQCVHRY